MHLTAWTNTPALHARALVDVTVLFILFCSGNPSGSLSHGSRLHKQLLLVRFLPRRSLLRTGLFYCNPLLGIVDVAALVAELALSLRKVTAVFS